MILRRLGNKTKIAKQIQVHFPSHEIYIEPFFGAGGMFFNKPKAKYNFANDLDSDVYNLYNVILRNYKEFKKALERLIIHQDLLKFWKDNQETDPILKAVRFLFLSNFTLYDKGDTLKFNNQNSLFIAIKLLAYTKKRIHGVQFANEDFRKFLKMYSYKDDSQKLKTLIYCDPPYLQTTNNYSESFNKQDAMDLLDALIKTGCKFCYSEFDNEFMLEQAHQRGLNVINIGERKNLKNTRNEILITNYQSELKLF